MIQLIEFIQFRDIQDTPWHEPNREQGISRRLCAPPRRLLHHQQRKRERSTKGVRTPELNQKSFECKILTKQLGSIVRQIREQQRSTELIIPKNAFRRLCREIVQDMNQEYMSYVTALGERTSVERIGITATDALQEAAEAYMHEFFTCKA